MATEGLRSRLAAPVPASSLAFLERGLGLILLIAVARFFAYDWIDRLYVQPKLHFGYYGFGAIHPWPQPWLNLWFLGLGLLGLLIFSGRTHRAIMAVALLAFAYVELLDVTTYLNHYYLLSCLLFLSVLTPRPRFFGTVPRWSLYLFRFQVGLVYLYAGLAKLEPDWLFRGEPLGSWLLGRTELGFLGALVETRAVAIGLSWAGLGFDLGVVPLLLWRRTRPFAFAALLAFHSITAWLFPIGVFPLVMTGAATLFFDPAWPERWWARLRGSAVVVPPAARLRFGGARGAVLLGYAFLQLLLPLRCWLYPGSVSWSEEGFRFSWRVMLVEKHGVVRYSVRLPGEGQSSLVYPSQYLTPMQEQQLGGQPDLILQLAHRIADDYQARGRGRPEVRADVWVSKNGGPLARLIDETVDLAQIEDGLRPKPWILPEPGRGPRRLGAR